MRKYFLAKLAASNLRKNKESYFPWLVTCILTAAMFYIMVSLFLNPNLKEMVGGDILAYMLLLGSCVVGIFAFIFLFYTYSFLLKRRKKEFGVFNILGLEKKHISIVLMWEMFYAACISLAGGLAAGIALDKVMFLLITRMLDAEIVLGFFLSPVAVGITVVLFSMIFLSIYLYTVHQIRTADPVELLRAGSTGEKEPKAKWFLAVLGLGCLAAGYYIALTVENPIASLLLFFVAVVLVMAGTYLLFTAGSIVLLKMLRKNKRYYYQTRHFTSISGMMYRMKQNAAGLASICVLSTGVLILISTTVCVYLGTEDSLRVRYPRNVCFDMKMATEETTEKVEEIKEKALAAYHAEPIDEVAYFLKYYFTLKSGNQFVPSDGSSTNLSDYADVECITLEDYNRLSGRNVTLEEKEVLVYPVSGEMEEKEIRFGDVDFQIKEVLEDFPIPGERLGSTVDTFYLVLADKSVSGKISGALQGGTSEDTPMWNYYCGFDLDMEPEEQLQVWEELNRELQAADLDGSVRSVAEARSSFYGTNGGLLFLGIFLGFLFLMATILIIYYKQISEGYEDRERYQIMQKVGMSRMEVKKTIRSQVLTVFYLPLIMAGIHILAAFHMIRQILLLMGLLNVQLFVLCTIGSIILFALLYCIVYGRTAKTYYKIIS